MWQVKARWQAWWGQVTITAASKPVLSMQNKQRWVGNKGKVNGTINQVGQGGDKVGNPKVVVAGR